MDNLLRLVEKAGLEHDSRVQRLLSVVGNESVSGEVRESCRTVLKTLIVKELNQPFDRESLCVGSNPVRIGLTGSGFSFISESDLQRHCLVSGRTGSGKTTLFYNLMLSVSVPWTTFDLKRDYRHLANRGDIDVTVIPVDKLGLNPLKPPPGVPLNIWVQRFAEIFCDSQALLNASKNYLKQQTRRVLLEENCFPRQEESVDCFPNFVDLFYQIKGHGLRDTSLQDNYRVRVLNRVREVLQSSYSTWNVDESIPIRNLLKRNVVVDGLGDYGSDFQNFVMEFWMQWVYSYRKHNNMRDNGLRHLYFLDECKTVFSKHKEAGSESGIPEVVSLFSKMREFGDGVVAADQEPSKLMDSIKSNSGVKVLLDTGAEFEFDSFADAMDLTGFQRRRARSLEVGEAVVQGGRGVRFVDLTDVEVEKDVTDERLEELMGDRWRQLVPEARFSDLGVVDGLDGFDGDSDGEEDDDGESGEGGVDLGDFTSS